jgi:hypothetical protein
MRIAVLDDYQDVTRESYRVYYEGALEAIRAWQGGAPIRLLQ